MSLKIFKMTFIAVALVGSTLAYAQSSTDDAIYVSNTDIINLDLDKKSVTIAVPYPGTKISGVCGIEIRADSYGRNLAIKNFLDEILITSSFGPDRLNKIKPRILNDMTIFFAIPDNNAYGFWFSIETKNGSTLNQTIRDTLGDSRNVVLLGSSCL